MSFVWCLLQDCASLVRICWGNVGWSKWPSSSTLLSKYLGWLNIILGSRMTLVLLTMHPVQNQPNCAHRRQHCWWQLPTTLKTGLKPNERSFLPSNSPYIYMRSSILQFQIGFSLITFSPLSTGAPENLHTRIQKPKAPIYLITAIHPTTNAVVFGFTSPTQ